MQSSVRKCKKAGDMVQDKSTKHIKWKSKHGKKISASICSVFEITKLESPKHDFVFCNRTLVTTWKHFGRKDCNWRGSASFIRVCLWSGPLLLLKGRGWPWLEYDNVSNCFEKRGYVYIRAYVCRGMVSRIKGVILGPLCQDVHPLRVFDPAFTTMACTLMASKGGYMLETL